MSESVRVRRGPRLRRPVVPCVVLLAVLALASCASAAPRAVLSELFSSSG